MDFNKFSQQATSFMNNQKMNMNSDQSQAPTDSNTTPTNDTSNAGGMGSMGNQGSNTGRMMGSILGGMGGNQSGPNQNASSADTGNEDYGDEALDFIEKKTGHILNREQNEKITDSARGMFEKATGHKLDSKWSN